MGRPSIPLSPGVSISNLATWLHPWDKANTPSKEDVAKAWRYLLEYLPPGEAPQTDPLLEEWRRTSVPIWKDRLREAEDMGDSADAQYSRRMLEVMDSDDE